LLHSAGVSPDLITNENIKNNLIARYNSRILDTEKDVSMDFEIDKRKFELERPLPIDEDTNEMSETKRRKLNDDPHYENDSKLETPS
jgi:hypothetical protein